MCVFDKQIQKQEYRISNNIPPLDATAIEKIYDSYKNKGSSKHTPILTRAEMNTIIDENNKRKKNEM